MSVNTLYHLDRRFHRVSNNMSAIFLEEERNCPKFKTKEDTFVIST